MTSKAPDVDSYLKSMSDADIYEALRKRLKDELSVDSIAQRGSREAPGRGRV